MKNTIRISEPLHFPVSRSNPAPPPPLFAVLQIGGVSIFGLGRSCSAAIAEARRVLSPDTIDLEALPNFPPAAGELSSGFYMARVSERFADAVQARGGCSHMAFTVDAGGLFDLQTPDGEPGRTVGNVQVQNA